MTPAARVLTPLSEAVSQLVAGLRPVEAQRMALSDAVGAVLAEALAVPAAIPPHAVARRAGHAVASHETVGASPYSPAVPLTPPRPVVPGDILPDGYDAVLDPGDVSADGPFPEILAQADPGLGVRRAGEDMAAGTVLRAAGLLLRSRDAALAAAAGLADAAIRRPRVVLWTPRPDADAGSPPPCGEGSTAPVHLAFLARAALGPAARLAGSVSPEPPRDGDLVIGVGEAAIGSGVARLQAEGGLAAHGIALAPGAESACGRLGGVPLVLLPGRPEEALAGLLLLARPCLDALCAAPPRAPDRRAPLAAKIASAVGLTEIALLRHDGAALRPLAVGDLPWSALAAAEAWTALAPESEGHAAGETVAAFALDWAP